MSADNEDTPEQKRLSVSEAPLGENEMFRVRRREVGLRLRDASEADLQEFDALMHEGRPDNTPFELRMELEREAIEAELDDLGWPPPRGRYFIVDDRPEALPEDLDVKLAAETRPMTEVLHPAAHCRIETGANYIKRRTEPLSRPWWLGHLGEQIIEIRNEPDPDRRLTLTLFYGRDRQRFADQHGHLVAVRRGADRQETLHKNNEERKAAAALWQKKATDLAAEVWARDPNKSANVVAEIVHKKFRREEEAVRTRAIEEWVPIHKDADEDESRREAQIRSEIKTRGLLSANGNIPSSDSIRGVIADLSPKRRA